MIHVMKESSYIWVKFYMISRKNLIEASDWSLTFLNSLLDLINIIIDKRQLQWIWKKNKLENNIVRLSRRGQCPPRLRQGAYIFQRGATPLLKGMWSTLLILKNTLVQFNKLFLCNKLIWFQILVTNFLILNITPKINLNSLTDLVLAPKVVFWAVD